MIHFIYILALITLAVIFVQDLKFRAISWLTIPILFTLLSVKSFFYLEKTEVIDSIFLNVGFVFIQIFILILYFSLKNKKFEKVVDSYLGLGDILFFLALAPALGFGNFILFLVVAILITLVAFSFLFYFKKVNNNQIPLAGILSLFFSVWLIFEWSSGQILSHTYLPLYFAN